MDIRNQLLQRIKESVVATAPDAKLVNLFVTFWGCFTDQDLIFFNVREYVLRYAIACDYIHFTLQKVLKLALQTEKFHSDWFGIV